MSNGNPQRGNPPPRVNAGVGGRESVFILLIEDNPGDARLVVESFRHAPFETEMTHVATLAEAQEHILQGPPDLVLLDLNLPDSQGLDTVTAIRRAASAAAIVVLTGTDDRELAVEALEHGAQDYLVKGAHNGDFLERAVRFALSRKTLVSALEDRTAELEETSAELAAILEGSPTPMLVVNNTGAVSKVNRAAAAFARRPIDELIGLRGGEALRCLEAFIAPGGCGTGAECETCPIRTAVNRTLEHNERIDRAPVTKMLRNSAGPREYALEVSTFPVETAHGRMAVVSVEDVTARTMAERAVRQSEQRLMVLIGNLHGLVYRGIIEPGWPMDFVSDGFEPLTGFTAAELTEDGRVRFGRIIHPEDDDRVWNEVVDTAPGDAFELEYRIVTKNGDTRWVWERGRRLDSDGNGSSAIEGFITDVTERRLAEEAVQASEQRYRQLYENSLAGVYRTTRDGRMVECNAAMLAMLGLPEGTTPAGMDVESFWVDQAERATFVEEVVSRGRVGNAEVEIRRRDGSIGWLLLNAALAADGPKGTALLEGTAIDITARKQAEARLSEQLSFLATLLDAIPTPVFYKDSKGRYRGCNRAFERFIGTTAEALVGKTAADLAPPELAAEYERRDKAIFAQPGIQVYESRVVAADGAVREVEFSKATYADSDGDIAGLVGVITDLTAHREIEAALHQAQKMEALGQLAGGVAHDFNNLLQAMVWLVDELGNPAAAPTDRAAAHDEMSRLVSRASQLTRQLLLFSRRETARPEVLDLNDVVRSSEELLSRLLRESIRLDSVPADAPTLVEADSGQLEQVIMNLAVNAQDAMPDGGCLTLRVTTKDGYAELEVADTGHGMPPEVAARIFEPFFTTKERGKGTGLGMAVVHGIVTASRGIVEVASREGEGTTFRIRLPLIVADAPPAQPAASAMPVAPAPGAAVDRGEEKPGTVLVVDDEPAVREVLRRTLAHQGFDVATAGDVATALEVLDGWRPALLITDMMLPDGTGSELISRIRELHGEVPVVLVSGYTEHQAAIRGAAESGAVEFLQKPFSVAELTSAVNRALADQDRAKGAD